VVTARARRREPLNNPGAAREGAAGASAAEVNRFIADGTARNLNGAEGLVRARSEGVNLLLDYVR
jgi:hypothetical protein